MVDIRQQSSRVGPLAERAETEHTEPAARIEDRTGCIDPIEVFEEQGGPGIADGPVMIRAGDLDGDGDQDLVTISVNDDELIWWENTGDASTVIFIDGFESGDTSSWL